MDLSRCASDRIVLLNYLCNNVLDGYLEDYYGGVEFKNKPNTNLAKQKYLMKISQIILNMILILIDIGSPEVQNEW